ncbi:hypothetical protein [Paenibacillus gorillae]|uniref:hypothetical protein n=1 Tax=Paenibacillus gorillae TaxID=1243662 RepID=UPI0004AE3928|nr:hypothetical protein [Paenibacillus gorillae]
MAKITIQYDNDRPEEVHEVSQFVLVHVPPSELEENLIMTAQCSNEFLRKAISDENAKDYYKQAFKAMSNKRLGKQF